MRTEHLTTIGGHARGYSVHTPDAPPAARRTVLFVLHGSYEDADGDAHVLYPVKRFERNYDTALFAPLRESEQVVTVYLAARYHAKWFCWEGGGGEYDLCSLPRTGDDEALLREALVTAEARAGGAAGRTFLFGMSGGAFQAWILGCSTTGLLDGIGVVAGALAPSRRVCCCDVPHAVVFHGTSDAITDVAWEDETVAWYADAHNCAAPAVTAAAGEVERRAYAECKAGRRLTYYRVAGGGHTIPGAPFIWKGLGYTSDFDALAATWAEWTGAPPRELPSTGGDSGARPDVALYAGVGGGLGAIALIGAAVGLLVWRRRRQAPVKPPSRSG